MVSEEGGGCITLPKVSGVHTPAVASVSGGGGTAVYGAKAGAEAATTRDRRQGMALSATDVCPNSQTDRIKTRKARSSSQQLREYIRGNVSYMQINGEGPVEPVADVETIAEKGRRGRVFVNEYIYAKQ